MYMYYVGALAQRAKGARWDLARITRLPRSNQFDKLSRPVTAGSLSFELLMSENMMHLGISPE